MSVSSSNFSFFCVFVILLTRVLAITAISDFYLGDISLLRFIRGGRHDVEQSASLFREHLQIRKKFKLDEIRERLTIQDAMLHESNGLEPDPRWPITMKRWNQTDMIYGKNYYRF